MGSFLPDSPSKLQSERSFEQMARKGENIYKRKDGRWEGRYIRERTPEGQAVYGYVYGRSYREVKEKKMEAIIAPEDEYQGKNKVEYLFQDAAEKWLYDILPQVKESTGNKYQNLIETYIYPDYRDTPLIAITQRSLEEYQRRLLRAGGVRGEGLSPKTVTDILSVLGRILTLGEREGYPVSCNISSIRTRQSAGDFRILSRSEQTKLCRYLYANLDGRNMGILLCLFTGLRIGEICVLRWGDLSFPDQTIHVHQTMQRVQDRSDHAKRKTKVVVTTPKSSCSIRTIPVPAPLMELMSSHRREDEHFFLSDRGGKWVEPRNLQYHFKRVLEESYLEEVNFHTLRHTFATRCVEVGVDVKSLSEILGHANVNITLNRYVHPSMEMKKESMQRQFALFAVRQCGQPL